MSESSRGGERSKVEAESTHPHDPPTNMPLSCVAAFGRESDAAIARLRLEQHGISAHVFALGDAGLPVATRGPHARRIEVHVPTDRLDEARAVLALEDEPIDWDAVDVGEPTEEVVALEGSRGGIVVGRIIVGLGFAALVVIALALVALIVLSIIG